MPISPFRADAKIVCPGNGVAPPIDGSCDMMQLPGILANLRGKFMFVTRGSSVLSHFAELHGWAIYALDRKRGAAKEEWVLMNY